MAQSKFSTNYKHGYYKTPTWISWKEMRYRCKQIGRKYYDKGIRVCGRWQSFENFLEDMGERLEGTSIDRIDGSKGYCKENCRWATEKVQQNNRSSKRLFTYNGMSLTFTDWADVVGIKKSTLSQRFYVYKWSLEKVLSTKVN